MLKRIGVLSPLLALLAWPAAAQTFYISAIPDQDESRLMERFGKIAGYLTRQLGVEFKYLPVKSYEASVTGFRNNQIQMAWYGGLTGVQARLRVPGSEAIVQGFEDQAFVSYFIANTGTGLERSQAFPTAIAGRTFTFGSKGSTSGRLMPEFFIREAFGKAPDDVFRRVGFSGDHSKTIALVQSGAYEVGALNYEVWNTELAKGRIDTRRVKVIWQTPAYPDYHWVIRGDVDSTWGGGFKERVRQALLSIDDPLLMKVFARSKFVPAKNSDYDPILKTGQAIGVID
ncbi:MAG: putative selenate ABC transporter substrate-binding protein [Candidatus Lambdaproteobacteria bacterium]|nr:putative selenate ABC transporter substrate-binding protein [Candidatus Lambdaproteobacteria bacterium]